MREADSSAASPAAARLSRRRIATVIFGPHTQSRLCRTHYFGIVTAKAIAAAAAAAAAGNEDVSQNDAAVQEDDTKGKK
jgi:hypothetical protein